MITLRELLQLNETVTLLSMYVRRPEGSLIRRSIIGRLAMKGGREKLWHDGK